MVDLSEADRRAIFGDNHQDQTPERTADEQRAYAAQRRRGLLENIANLGWVAAFLGAVLAGAYFAEAITPYDPTMAIGSAVAVVVGIAVAIVASAFVKKV